MAIIVIDTATDTLGVGIGWPDGRLTSSVVQRIPRGHSRLLQPSIHFVMQSSGLTMQDIDVIGIGMGPGSYTGVRMAVATGKAMAHAGKIPVVPISTVEAMAQLAVPIGRDQMRVQVTESSAVSEPMVLAMLHARRHRAYGSVFTRCDGRWQAMESVSVKPISEWCNDERIQTVSHLSIIHDFPRSEPIPFDTIKVPVSNIHWSDVASGFPGALLRVCIARLDNAVSGDAIHELAPDYALPVEAEMKVAADLKGVRE